MMHRRIRKHKKISHDGGLATIYNPGGAWGSTTIGGSSSGSGSSSNSSGSGSGSGNSGKFWENFTANNVADLLSDLFGTGSSYYNSKTAQYNSELATKLNQGDNGGGGDKTNYKPWIIAGASLLVIVLVIVLLTRKK